MFTHTGALICSMSYAHSQSLITGRRGRNSVRREHTHIIFPVLQSVVGDWLPVQRRIPLLSWWGRVERCQSCQSCHFSPGVAGSPCYYFVWQIQPGYECVISLAQVFSDASSTLLSFLLMFNLLLSLLMWWYMLVFCQWIWFVLAQRDGTNSANQNNLSKILYYTNVLIIYQLFMNWF